MRTLVIVVMPPARELDPGFCQRAENFFIEQLVTQSAVEAFDEGVLGGLSGLNQFELDAVPVGPLVQCSSCELWPLVGSDRR